MRQSRTPIDSRLLHSPESVANDALRFDALCDTAQATAINIVSEAMKRETSATGAETLAEEARAAIKLLERNSKIADLIDDAQTRDQLRQFLEQRIPAPDHDEVVEQAREVTQVLMSSWLELLRTGLHGSKALPLSHNLLPESQIESQHTFLADLPSEDENAVPLLMKGLATYVINDSDVRAIMAGVHQSLFPEPRLVRLPLGISMVGSAGSSGEAKIPGWTVLGDSPIDLCAIKHATLEDLVGILDPETWRISLSGRGTPDVTSLMPRKLEYFATSLSDSSAQAILKGVAEKLLAWGRPSYTGATAASSKTFKSQT